jgi:hypothetical protein
MSTALRSATFRWEEMYGPDQPVEPGDVPVLDNGICRIEYEPQLGVFSVQRSFLSLGYWVPIGRLSFYDKNLVVFNGLIDARLYSWTPEKAVVRAVLGSYANYDKRAELFITLCRGWTGPRIDMYVTEAGQSDQTGAFYFCPHTSGQVTGLVQGFGIASNVDTWTQSANFSTIFSPFIVGQVEDSAYHYFGIIPDSAAQRYHCVQETYSYSDVDANTRKAIGLRVTTADSIASLGVVSGRVITGVRGQNAEAETYRNAAATQVADAAAVGGQAVQVTGAAPTAMVDVPIRTTIAGQPPLTNGVYYVAARTRVVTGGQTGIISFATNNGSTGTGGNVTSTSYIWIVGQILVQDATTTVTVRGGGAAGGHRVDRVFLIPKEREILNLVTENDREGVMDQVGEAFMAQGHEVVILPR